MDAAASPAMTSTSRQPAGHSPGRGAMAVFAVTGLLFAAAVLPALGRLDFFDGVEHFNLATVQEARRDEAAGRPVNWMLPTLQGEARVVKPPLTAWLTAALVRPGDAAALSDPDPAARDAAFARFVYLARLPTLACAVFMLVGIAVLGCAVSGGDWRVGAAAAVVSAGTVLFFQQGRRATTDLQLALWVTWANALLAVTLFRDRPVIGYLGAGLAVGLAGMAKGPHIAVLLTVVPLALPLWAGRRLALGGQTHGTGDAPRPARRTILPIVASVVLALVVGLWWYGYVAATVDGIWDIWRREVTRTGAQIGRNVMAADPWHTYPSLLPTALLPFAAWVVVGAGWAVRDAIRGAVPADATTASLAAGQRPARPRVPGAADDPTVADAVPFADGRVARRPAAVGPLAALSWLVVPLVVMSCFAEKKERYLLPLVGSAAVLAGWAAVRWWDLSRGNEGAAGGDAETDGDARRSRRGRLDVSVGTVAGVLTFAAAAGLLAHVLVAGGTGLKGYRTSDDRPWFSPGEVAAAAGIGLALLAAGVAAARRSLLVPLTAVMAVAFVAGEMRLRGLAAAPGDRDDRPQRELAARVWREWPDAAVYSADPVTLYGQLNRPAVVLSMHLNRVIRTRPADWSAAPTDRPVVLLTDVVGDPPDVPTGFQRAAEVRLRKGTRYVDVRPAGGG